VLFVSTRERAGQSDRTRRRRGRRIVSAGEALQALLEAEGVADIVLRYRALAAWAEVVGPRIAAVTIAQRVENGVLFVSVSSAPWRAELTMRRQEIVKKLNDAVGNTIVADIRFR